MAPFATKAQLYTLLADRTAVDRQLDELRRSNAVRVLQLPTARDEYALMLTEDYVAALERCKAELLQRSAGGSSGGKSNGGNPGTPDAAPAAAAAAAAARAAQVIDWMAYRVLPACTQVMVTHAELAALLAGGSGAGAGAAQQPW